MSTEIVGTEGKIEVNLIPRANNIVLCDKRGKAHEVQGKYWQRFEHTFATEAQEFVDSVLKDTPVPLPLKKGMRVMEIARGLQSALWSETVTQWDEKGVLVSAKAEKVNGPMNGAAH